MLRRKQFELFTYFVIDLWIIRALSADLAAYSVVHSSSSFSLVLLITTIITKKLAHVPLFSSIFCQMFPGSSKTPGRPSLFQVHTRFGTPHWVAARYFSLYQYSVDINWKWQLNFVLKQLYSFCICLHGELFLEFHYNCYQLSQPNSNFQSCNHGSLGLRMSRDNMPSFNLLKANRK